ncbi:MSCRAMM family protein [Lentilactobacillus senioris]|uniref:MSCRAMM family protein n=1 Tax=Lentilactobacillus senioris TaxID=931534 RepID=UPI0006D18FAE|nr:SpaA isopeptide-forming pilin-related protein [Lentilactobacillus senioris]
MKKWLRIVFFLSFLVIAAPFPLVIIQAQERGPTIKNATVEKISDSKSDQAKLSIILDLDADEEVNLELADNEQANFDDESEIKIDEKQIKADLDKDNQERLMVENITSKAQTVTLEVPLAINYQTTADKLKLQLLLNHDQEKYDIPEFNLSNNNQESKIADPNSSSVFEEQSSNTSTSKEVTKEEPTNTNKKVASKASQKQVTARQVKKQAESSSTKAEATEEADDEDGEEQKTIKPQAITPSETVKVPDDKLDVYRTQVSADSWSSKLSIDTKNIPGSVIYGDKTNLDGGYWNDASYENDYYKSYKTYVKDPSNPNDTMQSKAYAVKLPTNQSNASFYVKYDNVGVYYEDNAEETLAQQMGAIIKISNIKYSSKQPTGTSNKYIDFSNNFYSGLVYNNIESFDIDITFTTADGTKALSVSPGTDSNKSFITFGSLNGNSNGNEWAGTNTVDENGNYIEGILSDESLVKKGHDSNGKYNGWYEGIGEGVWEKGHDYSGANQWGDFLGSTDYEQGAVSFPISGVTHKFKLRSDYGFTWQSISSGSIRPLKPEKPIKTVHRTENIGIDNNNLDKVTIDRNDENMNSFYYTIYQKTYNIPDKSIAKPNKIIFTDTLPEGMSVTSSNIRLYNTDGNLVTATKGNINIVGQSITYSLSNKEIEALEFNGGHFAIQMKVTFSEKFIGTFTNKANVKFDSGVDYTWDNDTNEVVTKFVIDTDNLTLVKKGENPWNPGQYNLLPGATFNLKEEGATGDGTEYTTGADGTISLIDLDRSKKYILTENTMNGYDPLVPAITISYDKENKKWTISDNPKATISDKTITVNNTITRGSYNFQKIDSASKNGLNGAKFVVKHGNDYLTFDANGKMTGTVASQDKATVLESKSVGNTDGLISISGLPYNTYELIEVEAPNGYSLDSNPTIFIVNKDSGGDAQIKKIENTHYSLPVTGGDPELSGLSLLD